MIHVNILPFILILIIFPSTTLPERWGYLPLLVRLLLRFLSNKHRNQHSHYPYNEIDCRIQDKCRFPHVKEYPCSYQK